MEEDPTEEFRNLTAGLDDVRIRSHPIGEMEEERRRQLGDDRYEEIVAFNDKVADANYDGIVLGNQLSYAWSLRHGAVARLLSAARVAIIWGTVTGVGWSVWYMVKH